MADTSTIPTASVIPSGGTQDISYNARTHSQSHNDLWAYLVAWVTKIGAGVANQAPAVGRLLLGKLDGTTEWLPLHLFSSLRNPSFENWPKGTSVAVPASTDLTTRAGYGPTDWSLKTGVNQASHWTQVAGLNDPSQFAAKVGRDSGQTGTGTMVAEQAYRLATIVAHRNQKISLGLSVKAGANWSPTSGNLTIRLACGTGAAARRGGSAYTGETTLISQTVAISTTKADLQYVSSVVVPTNATQMSLSFEFTPVGTAGVDDTFTVDDVMINVTDVPMPFKARPDDDFQCLRDVMPVGGSAFSPCGAGACTTTSAARVHVPLPVQMQAPPILTVIGSWALFDSGTNAINSPVLNVASTTMVELTCTASSGTPFTAKNAVVLMSNNDTTARLIFDAELL